MKILTFTFSLLATLSAATAAAVALPCPLGVRALFDVGSGSTKMVVIETRNCPGHEPAFVRFLDDSNSHEAALEASKDPEGNISKDGLQQLTVALTDLKAQALKIAKTKSPASSRIEFGAVGTHAVRTAKNLKDVVATAEKLGITLLPITQEEEALIGVEGASLRAVARPECKGKPIVVWDVGGGSQQWTVNSTTEKPSVSGLPLGSEAFKSLLIKDLKLAAQPACDVRGPTPNPIGHAHIPRAIALAKSEVQALPKTLRELKFDQVCVFGIGGVHNKAISERIEQKWPEISTCACAEQASCTHKPKSYSRRELDCLAEKFSDESDCDPDLKGPYSTTNASNLLLISGFMQALNIEQIYTENVNMGHGLAQDAGKLKSHFRSQKL